MALDPIFKMSMQNSVTGAYLGAVQNNDASWTVYTSSTLIYLEHLPQDWDKTSVTWARDNNTLGIFRSMSSNGTYEFAKDGRAILNYMRSIQGIQADVTLTIYICNAGGGAIVYDVFYASQLDFKTYSDSPINQMLSIGTMDSALFRDYQAYGGTAFNVPMWKFYAGSVYVLNDAVPVLHDGIKVLYNSTWTASCPQSAPFPYDIGGAVTIGGFNQGLQDIGLGGSVHTIPPMQQYAMVQNNGATTYIGNTLLQPFLVQLNQNNSVNGDTPGERVFAGANNSRPWKSSNCLLKNLILPPISPATTGGEITMSINIQASFNGGISFFGPNPHPYLGFALFEIDNTDNPPITTVIVAGDPSPCFGVDILYKLPITGASLYPDLNISVTRTFKYNKAYIFCLICDDDTTLPTGVIMTNGINMLKFNNLQVSFLSNYDNGSSGVPIPAPYFPPSTTLGFRLNDLASKLISYLPTRVTDSNGFPIVSSTPYNFVSSYLSDPSAPLQGDARPWQVIWSSAYCLHNLEGQSYVTASFNQLFDFCKKVFGCGGYIIGNTFYIERLSKIFDNTTMILDLGYDIDPTSFTVEQLTEGMGANLKLGYTAADLNSNFGTDSFNSELYFDTPLSTVPGVMDYEDDDVVIDQYAIELTRSQRVTQPIGSSINPASPSTDNTSVILYCQPTAATFQLPDVRPMPVYPPSCIFIDPNNNLVPLYPFQLTMNDGIIDASVPCAQSTDPTAATAPYVAGLYYPDRAFNKELSPCRALQRDTGALLHSVLDLLDSESLAFRNVYVMQYNNTTLGVTGIQSNLQVGAGVSPVVEFSDKSIAALPPQLFKPIKIKVKSKYPVNLYQTLNTNPNGYVRFFLQEQGYNVKEYKFFLTRAVQSAATGEATEFEGWATPDMVI